MDDNYHRGDAKVNKETVDRVGSRNVEMFELLLGGFLRKIQDRNSSVLNRSKQIAPTFNYYLYGSLLYSLFFVYASALL